MGETVIKVGNIYKKYKLYDKPMDRLKESLHPLGKQLHRDFYALNNISFEVKKGEILGVVGKNGSGKSTLLKIISGVLTPTAGGVEVEGKVSALLELAAGFNPEYTGMENIYLNGAILGYSRHEITLKMDEILSFADIGDFIHQPVKTYSSGMLVRLAFSVAVTVNPEILIVDEALSVGDALFQRKCFARIHHFIEDGKTVIFVSHSLDTVVSLCHRALLMDAGEIILDAKPKLVRNLYFKLMYSSGEEYPKIREEIISINQDPKTKMDLEKSLYLQDEGAALELGDVDSLEKRINQKDFYLPDFISKSTTKARKCDVDIDEIFIKNQIGETVNYINTNESYICSYKVRFQVAASKVNFGMNFKTIKGLVISGAYSPGKYPYNYIDQVKPGDVFLVDWHFKCSLLPGIYYISVGVSGNLEDQERDILIRILDALVFKVQDVSNSKFQGLVHLEQRAEIKKTS